MSLSIDNVRHVAELAKLSIADPEKTLVEMNQIMALMAQLQSANTSAVKPMLYPLEDFVQQMETQAPPLRPDVVAESDLRHTMPAASREEGNLYIVPKVID